MSQDLQKAILRGSSRVSGLGPICIMVLIRLGKPQGVSGRP